MGARASENVDDSDAEDDDCVDDVSEQVGLSDRFNFFLVFTHECVASIPAYSLEISKHICFFFIFISNIFLPFFCVSFFHLQSKHVHVVPEHLFAPFFLIIKDLPAFQGPGKTSI